MNLVLSGPIDDNLRNVVVGLSIPRRVVRLHSRADRFEGADDSPATRARVAELCDAARVDHAYIEEGRRFSDFKLLAMDMDSTLITIECIDEIADFAGKKKEVAAITEAAMRGEITDFAESLRRRVALLAGTDSSVLQRVIDERLTLSSGAAELLAAADEANIYTAIVSGGFTHFAEHLRRSLNIDASVANSMETFENSLTGRLIEPIIDSSLKRRWVVDSIKTMKLKPSEALVIGDGANDLEMMSVVGSSIAYHAKPTVRNFASAEINFGGLDVTLQYFSDVR